MFEKRTDLALESHQLNAKNGPIDGVALTKRSFFEYGITEVTVSSKNGADALGKPMGKYITLDIGNIWQKDSHAFSRAASALSAEVSALLPKNAQKDGILVAGLGNSSITPDSVGPNAVKSIIVTRHLKKQERAVYSSAGFGNVAAIAPGVLGQTGVESAEVIKSVCRSISPAAVVVIDALASRRLSRLATTVQLSDTGITPGSGVSNHRRELSKTTLGVPVISLGVPTVVDAATCAHDLLEEALKTEQRRFPEEVLEKILGGNGKSLFISPRDMDVIARSVSRLIALSLNHAFHALSVSELNELML